MYRLLHPGAAAGEVHAQGEGQLQVQAVAGGGVQPLRVLHHAPHRPQHHPPHDEGSAMFGSFCLMNINSCSNRFIFICEPPFGQPDLTLAI